MNHLQKARNDGRLRGAASRMIRPSPPRLTATVQRISGANCNLDLVKKKKNPNRATVTIQN
jgi:hypothetical protein